MRGSPIYENPLRGTMRIRTDAVAIVAVLLCAVVVAGEVLTYADVHSYGADAEWSDGEVDYDVSSSGSDVYDAVLIDNGGRTPVSSVAIYVDETYDSLYDEAYLSCGVEYCSQTQYAHEVTEALAMTYALPTEVYDGTSGCLLLQWARAGGTIYWTAAEAGRFHTDGETLYEVEDNQILLFGTECLNRDGPEYADSEVGNGFLDALTLRDGDLRYAADVSSIDGSIEMGFTSEGYASTAGIPFGEGSMFVVSGAKDFESIGDMAQIIASGITVSSEIVSHSEGDVVRGTVSGSIGFEGDASDLTLYIYIGGTYTKFGEAFHGSV